MERGRCAGAERRVAHVELRAGRGDGSVETNRGRAASSNLVVGVEPEPPGCAVRVVHTGPRLVVVLGESAAGSTAEVQAVLAVAGGEGAAAHRDLAELCVAVLAIIRAGWLTPGKDNQDAVLQ